MVLYKSSFFWMKSLLDGLVWWVRSSDLTRLLADFFSWNGAFVRVQVERMTEFYCGTDWSTGFNLPSAQPPEPQSSRIERTQLNMPLKGFSPSGWSRCCLMTASTEISPLYTARLHTCAGITPAFVCFFQGSALSNRHCLFGARTPGRCCPLRLDHTSPAVMIAVSRSRSLYHRLNSDVKDTLAVFSLYGSDTSTVNLSRWAKMMTKHWLSHLLTA